MNFSVLLSVYIKENPQYLSQALDSIINQSVQASEIIIVKDGPLTKELDDIIDQYNKITNSSGLLPYLIIWD